MEYRKEIDGLRAVAVLPVIFFHAHYEWFSGGFVGVDIFFVISGYLITTIILTEKEQGKFSIINFYERRARRILPALFFVLFLSIPAVWLLLVPHDLEDFSQSLTAVSIFASNIFFWREAGYFETASELKPLLHTWSLAVEEQFYVLFPLFLTLVWKLRKRWIFGLIIFFGLVSLLLAHWGAYNKPDATFFLLPTRAWELMLGVSSAFFLFYGQSQKDLVTKYKFTSEWLGAIGLFLIFYSIFTFTKELPFPSFYALVPTTGTVLIILFANKTTLVGQLLGIKLLVGIGLISYSAYLFHYPLFVFARHYYVSELNSVVLLILIIVTLLLAYFSWFFIENPFRNKTIINRNKAFTFSIVGSIVFLIVGIIGVVNSGFENRLESHQMSNYKLIQKHTDYDLYDSMFDNGDCMFWNRSVNEKIQDRFERCHKKYGKSVIVLGDSHAMNLFNIIAKSKHHPFVLGISQGGCRPQKNKPTCHYDSFAKFLERNKEKTLFLVFHQSGSYFVEDTKGNVDSSLAFENGQQYRFNEKYIESTIDYLSDLSSTYGVKLIWVGPFTEARVDFNSKNILNGNFLSNPNSIRIFSELERFLLKKIDDSESFDPNNYIPFNKLFEIKQDFLNVDGCITYRDIDHFSKCGEDIIADKVKPIFKELDYK